jgi:hypothetical protein
MSWINVARNTEKDTKWARLRSSAEWMLTERTKIINKVDSYKASPESSEFQGFKYWLLCICCCWDWSLNSGLPACKASSLLLEFILLWLFWSCGLVNYLSRLASNHVVLMVHTYNSSTKEAIAGESRVPNGSGLHSETLSQ